MRRSQEKPGKKAMRLHAEQQTCPRRRSTVPSQAMLSRCQTERGGKVFWDAEELDRDLASRWSTRIASEPFCPREARVGTLRAGKDHFCAAKRSCGVGPTRRGCSRTLIRRGFVVASPCH